MELFLDQAGNQLLLGRSALTRLDTLRVHQGDRGVPVILWLLNRTTAEGGDMPGVPLDERFDRIIIAARSKDNLVEASLLFSITAFTALVVDTDTVYVGTLFANTGAIADKFPVGSPKLRTIDALVDITFQNLAATVAETPIKQFPCVITRDLYAGTEDEIAPSGPSYPLPEDLVLIEVPGEYRFKAGAGYQRWNPDQEKFHSLSVRGVAGAEYLEIGAGED